MTVHLLIKGRVQGVFYRASAKAEAERLGLKGWIRNTKDGDVEAMVSGEDKALRQFISWCHQGPEHAVVSEVICTEKPEGKFEGFSILR